MVESVGSGVHMGDVKDGTYHLFHYTANDELRRHAARVAEGFAAYAENPAGDYGKYDKMAAALSPFRTTRTGQRPTDPNSPFTCGPNTFFCSNLVFLAYA